MKVLAVFNTISETNIPYENFLHVPELGLEKFVCTFEGLSEVGKSTITQQALLRNKWNRIGRFFIRLYGVVILARTIMSVRPDVVHVHHAASSVVAVIVARTLVRSKVVLTIHSEYTKLSIAHRLMLGFSLRAADVIVCNSVNTRNELEARFPSRKFLSRIHVIYNGVDILRIRRALQCGGGEREVRKGPARLLIVGRLVRAKGHDILIGAVAKLKRAGYDVVLDVVGDGPLKFELTGYSESLGLGSQVNFYGELRRDDVYRVMGFADCVIVSSRWEGFCNAMVEAMCAGIPVVATDIPVLKEVLGDDNGVFFSVDNSDSLASAIEHVFQYYDQVKSTARCARVKALENYDVRCSAEAYRRLYFRVCDI